MAAARQVRAVWSWSNYLAEAATARSLPILAINLDESSIPVVFSHGYGNVAAGSVAAGGAAAPVQPVTKSEARTNFTLVATICSEGA